MSHTNRNLQPTQLKCNEKSLMRQLLKLVLKLEKLPCPQVKPCA